MIEEESVILGIRYKEKEKNFKSAFGAAIFLIILSFGLAIGIVFLPSEPDQLIYKIMVSIFFGVLGLFFIFLLFVIKKNKAKALQLNEYSPIAIYYKNKSIFIDEGEVVEIKCEDIKKVQVSHNTKTVSYGIAQETTILPDGSITIVTKDKKKHVALQIKNIVMII